MIEPIRVLQIFGRMNRGGAETMIMNVYRNIDRSKIQFDFIVHGNVEGDYINEIYALGGEIYSIPRYLGKNHFQYKKAWKQFFKEYPQYKIMHSHVRSTASIYLKMAKEFRLTTIIHSHSTSSGKGFKAFIKNKMQRSVGKEADYRFACSEMAGKWLFRGLAFQVVNNGIDCENFKYDLEKRKKKRNELDLNKEFVIGHIGRFDEAKNHTFIIDIFAEAYRVNKNVRLLLIGDGKLRKNIEEKVKELGLKDVVIFTGVRADIPELLQAMDVFLFPSLFEGLGIVLIEAQAAGLPCVISNVIPKEVEVTNLVTRISLNDKVEKWAETLLSSYYIQRENSYDKVASAGYDIYQTTKYLEVFYLNENK